jgi:hypothetical protein
MPKTKNPGQLTKLFSSAMFTAFLSDLGRVTLTGLTESECDANKAWLDAVADAVTGIPESEGPGKRILDRCWDIKKVYDQWNFPEHSPGIRAELRKKLQDKVNKLSSAYAKRTKLLEENLDVLVYRNFYDATAELTRRLPDKLVGMTRNLAKFPHL